MFKQLTFIAALVVVQSTQSNASTPIDIPNHILFNVAIGFDRSLKKLEFTDRDYLKLFKECGTMGHDVGTLQFFATVGTLCAL